MNRMSRPRRAALKTVAGAALLPALGAGGALAQANPPARPKVLRYAFRVAETGFDPAQVNDLYSSNVIANIFESPLHQQHNLFPHSMFLIIFAIQSFLFLLLTFCH